LRPAAHRTPACCMIRRARGKLTWWFLLSLLRSTWRNRPVDQPWATISRSVSSLVSMRRCVTFCSQSKAIFIWNVHITKYPSENSRGHVVNFFLSFKFIHSILHPHTYNRQACGIRHPPLVCLESFAEY
jgi:hypothetical protein